MKIARVAVLGVAVGAGLIAAFIAMRLSAPAPATAPASQPQAAIEAPASKQVLVATQDIPLGTTLKSDSLKWSDWPATGVSDKFIARDGTPDQLTKIVGSIARASLYAGEPITEGKLIQSDNGFMSAILPSGMRAVATRISADTSAGGFILPNDHVDVIMTRKRDDAAADAPDGNAFTTETILNNVRVLAIDQTIEEIKGEKVVVGQTATLELTPQQSKILTVADQLSDHRLTLALRSIADSRPLASDAALDATHLLGGTTENGAVTIVRGGVAREVNALRQ
jgi:pilus assembly protein CpaB